MTQRPDKRGTWRNKFGYACRGIAVGLSGQTSFHVHALMALVVVAAGGMFGVSRWEWCMLTLCVVAVFAAELFNSALEELAKAVMDEENSHLRDALDMSAAAVLVAALGAVIVGLLILGPRAWAIVV